MVQLRGFVFLDSLQTQLAGLLAKSAQGSIPKAGQTSLLVETSPGIFINRVLDVAIKATAVQPSHLIVEREYGIFEVHHQEQGEVRQAGRAVLDFLGCEECSRVKPTILSCQIIRGLEQCHADLLSKDCAGKAIKPGNSLFILETAPAVAITFAANEAEKAAQVDLVDVRWFGAFGRLYLAGPESDIDSAAHAAVHAIESMSGA